MEDIHENLMYIAYNLDNQGQCITFDGIQKALRLMQFTEFNLQNEINWLVTNGFLFVKYGDELALTEAGKEESFRINKSRTKDDFDRLIGRLVESTSFLDYCEEVYGYRMYLFNMMDKKQLDYVFNTIPICNSDTVLDLGCGTGLILNNLVKKYGCNGIGIDQLNEAVVKSRSKMISYIKGDIDNLGAYDLKPTVTLSIDSLYFSSDLDGLIKTLKSLKNNRMYLFYSQYIMDENIKDKSVLNCDKTKLACILQENGLEYKIVDYSNSEYNLYKNALKVLPKFKNALRREGNIELFEAKLKEYRIGKEMYEKSLASRYLYIVHNQG